MFKKVIYKKRLKRNIFLLSLISFFSQVRLYSPVAILIYYSITKSYSLSMMVVTIISISIIVFKIPLGIFSDKYGRKPSLILEMASILISTIFYVFSFSSIYGIYFLYAGAIMYGIGVAFRNGNREAIIYETLMFYKKTKEYPKIQGRMFSMTQAALALSGIIAGILLLLDFSFKDITFLSIFPLMIGFILTFFIIEPKKHKINKGGELKHLKKAIHLIIKQPKLLLFAMASSLRDGFSRTGYIIVPTFIELVWPVWAISFFRTGQNGIGSLCFWFSGAIVKKLGKFKTLWKSSIFELIITTTALLSQNIFSPFLLFLSQIGYASGYTADSSIQQKIFSNKERVTMKSLISFTTEIITAISAVLIGIIADKTNITTALIIAFAFNFIPANIIYFYIRKLSKKKTSI